MFESWLQLKTELTFFPERSNEDPDESPFIGLASSG